MIQCRFTTPPITGNNRIYSYRAVAKDDQVPPNWWEPKFYSDSTMSSSIIPSPNAGDTVYCWTKWPIINQRTCMVRLVGIGNTGLESVMSNPLIIKGGCRPDTNYFDNTKSVWVKSVSVGGTGFVFIQRAFGDSVWVQDIPQGNFYSNFGVLVHQETIQLNDPLVCQQFGYRVRKGAREPCP